MRIPSVFLAVLAVSGCKNSLTYAPPGELECDASGAICSVGYTGVGDGGPALEASFVGPRSLAFGPGGELYVADRLQNRIRRIDPDGDVRTVAGTGRESYLLLPGLPGPESFVPAPITVAATDDGWVFWTENETCTIYGLDPATGRVAHAAGGGCDYGTGGNTPQSVRFDFSGCSQIRASGNDLVIADTFHSAIRYWNRGTAPVNVFGLTVNPGEIGTLGGITSPCAADVADDGTLFTAEADYQDCRVRRVTSGGGQSTILGVLGSESSPCGSAGEGVPGTSAQANYPGGIAFDEATGLVFVGDDSGRLRVVNPTGQNTTWGAALLGTGHVLTIAGTGSSGPMLVTTGAATAQRFGSQPLSPVIGPDGAVYVSDEENGVIRRIDGTDGTMSVVAGLAEEGTLEGYMNWPGSVAVLPDGSLIVASSNNARLWRIRGGNRTLFAGNGSDEPSGDGGPATEAGLYATAVVADEDGNVYVADARNHYIRFIAAGSGTISTIAGTGSGGSGGDGSPALNASFAGPHALYIDSSGNLVVGDETRVRYINLGVATTTMAGTPIGPQAIETIAGSGSRGFAGDGGPAGDASIDISESENYPTGIVIHDRTLYFAETRNNRIRKVDLDTGVISTLIGGGASGGDAVGRPVGLARIGDTLYWSQLDGSRVRAVNLDTGAVRDVAGDGGTGYVGEGAQATLSQLLFPMGLATDGRYLYVADGSHRVRRIRP